MTELTGARRLEVKDQTLGHLMIAGAAVVWGTQGPFAQNLMQLGCHPFLVSQIKLLLGCLTLMGIILFTQPKLLKVSRPTLRATALVGLISQAGFNSLYYTSVDMIGIANAAVLLYTAPVIFLVLSVVFFKEQLTVPKLGAAFLCVIGSAIAVTGGSLNLVGLSGLGILLAVLSAVTFAIMTAIGKVALKGCDPFTFIAYSFFFGTLFMLPLCLYTGAYQVAISPAILLNGFGIGLLPAALSYVLYFGGIKHSVSLSTAGVISSLEMVSAILIAWLIFHEPASLIKAIGILMIVVASALSARL